MKLLVVFVNFIQLESLCQVMTFELTKTVINSFFLSRANLLADAPFQCLLDRLRPVLNAAAKLLCGCQKYDLVAVRCQNCIQWLPAPHQIVLKLGLLTYIAVRGTWVHHRLLLPRMFTIRSGLHQLRSSAHGDLCIPRILTKFGDRFFSIACLRVRIGLTYVQLTLCF